MSIVGSEVEFDIDNATTISGTVIKHCEEAGTVVVEDEDGKHWKGYADSLTFCIPSLRRSS